MNDRLRTLKVKIFADGADKTRILDLAAHPLVKGFTTNPTLMKQAGIADYAEFARDLLAAIPDRPFSFEVFSDDFDEMREQALEIASWADNVYVKIPITNTKGESSSELVRDLSTAGVKVNLTAILTLAQVETAIDSLARGTAAYISVFAGRIADAGIDPLPVMKTTVELMRFRPELELIWASPREVLNVIQADEIGCHIITITNDILKKLPTVGKNLTEFSLDTVKMFRKDAVEAGFVLAKQPVALRA